MEKTKENFKKFTKEEKINLIDKTFRSLEVGIIALQEGINSVERFEKCTEVPEEVENLIKKILFNVYTISEQFTKNLTRIKLLVVTMWMEGGLSETQCIKYIDKLLDLRCEYDCLKAERSEALQKIMA